MMRRKLCNLLAALFSVLIIFPVMIMLVDREPPIALKYHTIEPLLVDAATPVTVTWTVIKHRRLDEILFGCDGTFVRRITDSGGFISDTKPQPLISTKLLRDRAEATISKIVVMPVMLPGLATYQIITTHWCNPFQKYLFPIVHSEEIIKFTFKEIPLLTGKTGATGPTGPQGPPGQAGKDR